MINKQNLWFITLFSLILVLSIYYLTMSDETLATLAKTNTNEETSETVEVEESDVLVALRVAEDENVLAKMEELQTILLDETATVEEKNDAYDDLQALNSNKGKEAEIEKLIKKEYELDSFVKISEDNINVVISSSEHSTNLANNIIKKVQNLYKSRMYITVKFQK